MIIVKNDCDEPNFLRFVVFIGLPRLIKGNESSKRDDALNNLDSSLRYKLFPFFFSCFIYFITAVFFPLKNFPSHQF